MRTFASKKIFLAASYRRFFQIALLFVLFKSSILDAQVTQSIIGSIKSEPINAQILDKEIAVFEDSTAQLSIADIKSGHFDSEFKVQKQAFPALFNPKSNFWLKLTLHSEASEARELILENRYPMLDFLTLYQAKPDGSFAVLTLGDEVDFEERPLAFRYPAYPLRLEVGSNVFYIKMQNKGRFIVSLLLWDQKNFAAYTKKDGITLGFIYGAIIVLTVYNMFLTISLRSLTYLLYVLYLISYLIMQFGIQATGLEWLGSDMGNWIMNRGWMVFGSISHVFACLFAASFLNMQHYMPRWIKWVVGLAIANIFIAIHCIFGDYVLIGKEVASSTVVVSFFLIAAGIAAALRGFRPAIFYSTAWISLLVGNLILTLMFYGLFPMNFLAQWGSFIGGGLEVALMSLALGSRMNDRQAKAEDTIRSLNEALKAQIQEVEKIVLERSHTIRSIIDHVKSGFFTIDEKLEIQPGFTKSCYSLLGDRLVQHSSVLNVLGLDGDLRKTFKLSAQQVFADELPEAVCLAQMPQSFKIGQKFIALEGGLIRNHVGKPQAILFTVNDVTKLQRKQRQANRSLMLIKILKNIQSFQSFLKIVQDNLVQLRDPIVASNSHARGLVLHTIKGNCMIFNMKKQAEALHKIEEKIRFEPADVDLIESIFANFLVKHREILNLSWEGLANEDYVVKQASFASLKNELLKLKSLHQIPVCYELWLKDVKAFTVKDLLGPISEDIGNLAKKTGRIVRFELLGSDCKIYSDAEVSLVKTLVHLVRNSIFHGIEPDRLAVNKPNFGQIGLHFKVENENLIIRCKDDGRGFDRESIARRLVEGNLVAKEKIELLSIADLVEILSTSHFSSAKETDLYAGRGVGIAAVFKAVKVCHGSLDIISALGMGAEFVLTIPRHSQLLPIELNAG